MAGCVLIFAKTACANDFPTADRVLYVQECMQAHPGPNFEMIQKCSCALDRLAETVKFDDYVTMSTVAKAITISGERGGVLRENKYAKPQVAIYRELQAKAEKACFIDAK